MLSFLSPEMLPFTTALALFGGLFALELVALLLGGTMMFGDGDADIDLDVPDTSGFAEINLEGPDLDGIDITDFDLADAGQSFAPTPPPAEGLLSLFGLGKMPFAIWLATLLVTFGVSGIALQTTGPWPLWLAVPPAAAVAIFLTGRFGRLFARLLPQNQTSAVSIRQLGSRRGVVTQGVARRGQPAEVRVRDGYGNLHYLRAEPHDDGDAISAGTDVLVLYHRPTKRHRLVAISDEP